MYPLEGRRYLHKIFEHCLNTRCSSSRSVLIIVQWWKYKRLQTQQLLQRFDVNNFSQQQKPNANSQFTNMFLGFFSVQFNILFSRFKWWTTTTHLRWPELFALTSQTHVLLYIYQVDASCTRLFTFWPSSATHFRSCFYAPIWYKTSHCYVDKCKQQTLHKDLNFSQCQRYT